MLGDAAPQVARDTHINAGCGAMPDAVDAQCFFTPPRTARCFPFLGAVRDVGWVGWLVEGRGSLSSSSALRLFARRRRASPDCSHYQRWLSFY